MHEDELWQDLFRNGELVAEPRKKGQKLQDNHVCAAAHLWCWRTTDNGKKEVLLQTRSRNKKSWPGFYDVSAAGHINHGEMPIISMIREAKEEINLDLLPDDLTIVGVYRLYARTWHDQVLVDELQWIYLHELKSDEMIDFIDGEVEAVEWISLSDFEIKVKDPSFKIVKHDEEYFALIINAIKRA